MEDIAAQRAAEWLLAEHRAAHRFMTLEPPVAPASIADAYDIQDRYVALLRGENGGPAGYKVGLTSATMQAFCRIDHPIAGVVLASRVRRSGAKVRRAEFGLLGLEFEIAVRIKADIPLATAGYTAATIEPYIDGVAAAVELVDDRAADYASLDVRSLVADNSWNAGIVLSDFVPAWSDLAPMAGRATRDGNLIGEGYGRDILGHPFNSLAWLASQLAARGTVLQAGQIVMTLAQDDATVCIEVADSGVGLPPERDRIVEPYMTTRARGTGLGLAIVKKIVEEHFGTIAFEDRLGGGTVVRLTFDSDLLARVETSDAGEGDQAGHAIAGEGGGEAIPARSRTIA